MWLLKLLLLLTTTFWLANPRIIPKDTDSEFSDVVTLVTKVSPIKQVYITYDTVEIEYPLRLAQLETTIDALSTKMASLQHSTSLENMQPLMVISQDVVLTLFQTVLPLSASLQACKSLELEPLTLSNLPLALRTSIPVLLHYEISVGTNSVLCVASNYTLKEDDCLKDILNRTRPQLPYTTEKELRTYLLSNFVGAVAHIVVTKEEAFFSASPFGNSACIGSYEPSKLKKEESSLDVKLLHDHFHEKLSTVYANIFDYLELMVSHLSDTIHSITSEEFILPIPLQGKEKSIAEIMALKPTYLPNHPSMIPSYPTFSEFFVSSLEKSFDYIIGNLSEKTVGNMPDRQRNILYSSLLQFNSRLTRRMTEYMKTFNLYQQQNFYLPKTLLFTPDQDPSTFLVLIRSILPTLDDNLLTEIFIILQNEKASLIQDVSFLFGSNNLVPHLSRSEYSKLLRQQWKNHSKTSADSELHFLHNYHNSLSWCIILRTLPLS